MEGIPILALFPLILASFFFFLCGGVNLVQMQFLSLSSENLL